MDGGGIGLKFILLGISFVLLISGGVLLVFGISGILRRRARRGEQREEPQPTHDDHRNAA